MGLIKELEGIMGGNSEQQSTQIIWTSSSNAKKGSFDANDIQHQHGSEPYSSSKYASDLVRVAINDRLNHKHIYSHTTCPGLVMTNLTYGILPSWFWYLVLPLLWLLRLFTGSMTQSPYNGSEALLWLSLQEPESLDPLMKYHSRVSILGNRYVEAVKMDLTRASAKETYKKLSDLENEYRSRYSQSSS
ncbi:3-keto-steroid reductase/17-beta-hydroxysteroid dehydrogenase 7-like [Liolophura sinensis]|uniref:3-keto-steroid reductase/17-beta-hydroxysteroid dehydrogenase 7-like n=1 Tax=Liolophura sinensis TaxID=3198878 RepID=UPI003158008F